MSVSKPYIEDLSRSPEATAVSIEWARYLGSTFGATGAIASLRYYRELDWITRDVYQDMVDYVQGLSLDEIDGSEPQVSLEHADVAPFDAHVKSLEYVADMAGDDFDEETLQIDVAEHRVEQESEVLDSESKDDQAYSEKEEVPEDREVSNSDE